MFTHSTSSRRPFERTLSLLGIMRRGWARRLRRQRRSEVSRPAVELLEDRTLLSGVSFEWEMTARTVELPNTNGRIAFPNTSSYVNPEDYEVTLDASGSTLDGNTPPRRLRVEN